MENLVMIALGTTVLLAILVLATMFVAFRADQAVTIRGPLATLEELESRINGKQVTLAELEAELAKRREAIGQISDIQADVDALLRKRDELMTEWNQLADRRREVLELRGAIEAAQGNLHAVEGQLGEKREELERLDGKLARAEQLAREYEGLAREHEALTERVQALRAEAAGLETLKREEADLRARIEDLHRAAAESEGRAAAGEARLREAEAELGRIAKRQREAEAELGRIEERLAALRAGHTEAVAQAAALRRELAAMEDQRAELLAHIEAQRERAGLATGKGGHPADPLEELRAPPPVLETLRAWPARALEEEATALQRVTSHMKAVGLDYHPRVLRAFHTAMKVNDTAQMAVLAGISGTGKSQLPRRYAEAMGIGFLLVPVQPRWDSPHDLMGFYNYIEGRYRPTDLARALYHLDRWNGPEDSRDLQERMMLVLLDEMNLARVEYYFSDFLSRLENRPAHDEEARPEARKHAEIELDLPMPDGRPTPRLYPGYNLLFAGTMNEDESTQTLSDKVVDRANVLRFAAPQRLKSAAATERPPEARAMTLSTWRAWHRSADTALPDRDRVEAHIGQLLEIMTALGRPFGHRLGRAILAYVANYPYDGHTPDIRVPLADQVEMRLLPKLRGVEMEIAASELEKLAALVEDEFGDADLARAIKESVSFAEQGTGQFLWRGVARE